MSERQDHYDLAEMAVEQELPAKAEGIAEAMGPPLLWLLLFQPSLTLPILLFPCNPLNQCLLSSLPQKGLTRVPYLFSQ